MYELYLQVKDLNPDCELVKIITDCLRFNNITHDPPTSNGWGDIKKCDVPLIKECTVNQQQKLRTEMYEPTNTTWNSITWSPETGYTNHKGIMIDGDLESYVEQGYLTIGMAGTGKSEILQEAQRILSQKMLRLSSLSQHVQHIKHVKLLMVLPYIDCLVLIQLITHMNIRRWQS